MAIVTRIEFASICNISPNAVNTYVGRGKIVSLSDKRIDTENPMNKIFVKGRKQLDKKRNQQRIQQKKAAKKKVEKAGTIDEDQLFTKPLSKAEQKKSKKQYEEADRIIGWQERKFKADALKAETDNELKKLQLEKQMGKLIPVDLMHSIFKINIQNVFISFENELINLASIYTDILAGGDRSKLAEIIDLMRQNLARIIKETNSNAAKEIEGVINEYAETRNRGEKK